MPKSRNTPQDIMNYKTTAVIMWHVLLYLSEQHKLHDKAKLASRNKSKNISDGIEVIQLEGKFYIIDNCDIKKVTDTNLI